MQAYSHFLVSIFIAKIILLLTPTWNFWLQLIIIMIAAFLSHIPIDYMIYFTYHPEKPHIEDKFWVLYHIFVVIFSLWIGIYFWHDFWWVMLMSIIPDIYDWGLNRAILHRPTQFHLAIQRWREQLFSKFTQMRDNKFAVIPELIIMGLLIWAILLI